MLLYHEISHYYFSGFFQFDFINGFFSVSLYKVYAVCYIKVLYYKWIFCIYTGSTVWSFKAAGTIWSAPVLSHDGQYIFFSSQDSIIYTLQADSGRLVRKFVVGDEHDEINSTPAISRDGTLFVGMFAKCKIN